MLRRFSLSTPKMLFKDYRPSFSWLKERLKSRLKPLMIRERTLSKGIILEIMLILMLIGAYSCCFLCFSVDNVPPQWRNQKQSKLIIPQGGYIRLQAEGMDVEELHYAILSTNETGVWRNITEPAFLWRHEAVFGFDNFGTATYEDGMLYAPSKGDNNVYAINASNGNIIWNRTVRQCDASPCISDGVVYVGECSGPYGEPTLFPRAMALNKTTGEEIWQFVEPHNSTWVGSPLVHGDYVYYTTFGSGVYALNKTDGSVIWQRNIGKVVCSVAYHNGVIFVSAYDPSGQYALNATTGEEVWHANYGASWDSSPVIYEGMVIQVTRDTTTGIWSTNVLNETTGELIRRFEGRGSPSTPLVREGKIFIPDDDWRMWAYNLTTGEELWHTEKLHNGILQDYSYSSPAFSGGAIYYQSLNGTFYMINETDGAVLWSYLLGDFGFGSPSVGDGYVFITNDFALYAFRIGPGSGDWPMFCQNGLHQSSSQQGVHYLRWPLTEPQYFKESNVWMTASFTWCNKTITSAAIAWRIYFFDRAGNTNATDVMIFYVNPPLSDIAVVNISFSKQNPLVNETISIYVTVQNKGVLNETFDVNVTYTRTLDPLIGAQTVALGAGESVTLNFTWTPTVSGGHKINACVSGVPTDANLSNNAKEVYIQVFRPLLLRGPYYSWNGMEYWIVQFGKHAMRLVSKPN